MTYQNTPQKIISVYVLIDPRNDKVRYVGVTNNPKKRLAQHIEDSKRKKTHRANWVSSLLRDGLMPIMTIIDETDNENWVQCEIEWIAYYRGLGCDLVNSCDGGRGVLNPSEESRRKNSEAHRGENHPMYGKSPSESTRRKQSEAMREKTHSEETRRKLAEKARGKHPSDETRRRMSESSPNKKTIYQYDKFGHFIRQWDSIIEASRTLSIQQSDIVKCCTHIRSHKSAGGYIWRYSDDPLPSNELTQKSFDFDE